MDTMETNATSHEERDRTMWFSMWFLASVITFGLAFFPMFYYSVERRNRHFRRQVEWERQVAAFFGKETEPTSFVVAKRNPLLWAASIVLVFPVFALDYFLTRDLVLHEQHQQDFLKTVVPDTGFVPQRIPVRKYALITLVTLGIGGVFWLYKIFNIYNHHFIEHRKLEDEINRLMEEKSHGEPM